MKYKDFEDYLMDCCFFVNQGIMDDDMPDFFDNWLGCLTTEEFIEYGDKFARIFKEQKD